MRRGSVLEGRVHALQIDSPGFTVLICGPAVVARREAGERSRSRAGGRSGTQLGRGSRNCKRVPPLGAVQTVILDM